MTVHNRATEKSHGVQLARSVVSPGNDAQAIPPRYRWLRRLSIAGAIVFVVTVAAYAVFAVYARRVLQAEISRCIAAGEPVSEYDFAAPADVPADDNAAVAIERALALLDEAREAHPEIKRLGDVLWAPGRNAESLTRIAAATEPFRRSLREACRLERCAWPEQRSGFPTSLDITGEVLVASALTAIDQGRPHAAVYIATDLLRLGRHVSTRPALLYQLLHRRHAELACALTERVLAAPGFDPNHPACDALMEELARDDLIQAGTIRGLYWERTPLFRAARWWKLADISGPPPPAGFPERHFYLDAFVRLDAVNAIRQETRWIEAAQQNDYATQVDMEGPPGRRRVGPFTFLMPSFNGIGSEQWKAIAQMRLARSALAARRYECVRGHLPAALGELVPEFLPAVPADPYSDRQAPLAIVPDEPYPHLSSVGPGNEPVTFYLRAAPPEDLIPDRD